MKALFDQISYNCSKNVTRSYSTSFSWAVKMLSPSIQPAIEAIYGFVRLADEVVDSFHDYEKEKLLNELEIEVHLSIERGISLNPILNAFQHVVREYNITTDLIDAFMNSMRADLHKNSYLTEQEYNQYIYGSADVVGLMCVRVFVAGDKESYQKLKPYAMKLGSAFQKVNFLRDFKADTEELDRSYFPNIEANRLSSENKLEIIEDIKADFEAALIGIRMLPAEAKFGVYTAYIYYKRLLSKLEKSTVKDIENERIRINNSQKVLLLAQSFFSYKLNWV